MPPTIASTYGALLLGGFVAAGYGFRSIYFRVIADDQNERLTGIVTVQMFAYYKLYPSDRVGTKFTVRLAVVQLELDPHRFMHIGRSYMVSRHAGVCQA